MTPKFVDGNKLQLLRNGTAYFPALQQAIDVAKSEIYLETYIFRDDETGQAIAAALARAAQRGVAVRVLVDGFGCKDHFAEIRERLLAAKVQVLIYRPKISPLTLRRNRLRRMHRKLAVIDARVAFAARLQSGEGCALAGAMDSYQRFKKLLLSGLLLLFSTRSECLVKGTLHDFLYYAR